MYNGHMQISLNSRDEILESKFIKAYVKEVALMREELVFKDAEIETMKQLVETWATKERGESQLMESQIGDYAEEMVD